MKCPFCQNEIEDKGKKCPICGEKLPRARISPLRFAVAFISWILVIAVIAVGVYKLYYWFDVYRFERLYTRGVYTPTITETVLSDGRTAHSITYYGRDGGRVYISQLGRMIEFSGGVAKVEIPDSYWFGSNVEQIESADVSVGTLLIYENGDQRRLPVIDFTVAAPESPVSVISPERDNLSVNTSIYPLKVQVVPGSTVTVNGKDVTDIVDRAGLLSVNVNVFPVGDNTYSIIVKTPSHKETRHDIMIHRDEMEIAVELDSNTPTNASTNIVTISGKCEPGALISVDTDYVENSITQNESTGAFSFIAKMSVIGDNTVRFRASMPGKADSIISLVVDYLPTLDEYSRKAWAMDYGTLCSMFDRWEGRIFLCDGVVVDVITDGDDQYVIMDVAPKGSEEKQLLALLNLSSVGTPVRGRRYAAYADVDGRYLYDGHYYPLLKARYMDVKAD